MKKSKGFTLLELLAVIVIVGILITLVSIGVTKYVKTSKEKVKVQAAEEIIEIAKAYMSTNNVYFVSTKTLVDEGYLEGNFTDPNTGKEHQGSDNANIFVITCTDNSCTKDTNVSADGFSTDKFYLSLNSTLNEKLTLADSTSEDFLFNKENLEVTIGSNTYTKYNTIGERIRKLYEVNENKGVLVMSLAKNEKEELKKESGFENVDSNCYLYYEGETLKSDTIANGNNGNMKYLVAKYIVNTIKKNNKNNKILKPKSMTESLSLNALKTLVSFDDVLISNNIVLAFGKSADQFYVGYFDDEDGIYYQVDTLGDRLVFK